MQIKFIMSKGDDLTFPEDKAQAIMSSPQQIVQEVVDGKWTGRSINKAHIVSTYRDKEAEKYIDMDNGTVKRLKSGDNSMLSPEEQKKRLEYLAELKKKLKEKGTI